MHRDLSIVIVSYNAPTYTASTLRSYRRAIAADPEHDYEVILVDNASRFGVLREIGRECQDVRVIRNSRNMGFAAACNIGYRESRGRYLLFSNPDVEITRRTLPTLINLMDDQPDVAACTPFLELADTGELETGAHRGFPTPWASFTYFAGLSRLCRRSQRLSRVFGRYHLLDRDLETAHEVDVIEGGFFFVRRDVIERLGGWDEDYFLYGEDVDLCYRIVGDGHRIMYFPQTRAFHKLGVTTGLKKNSAGATEVSLADRQRSFHAFYDSMKIFYGKHYRRKYGPVLKVVIFAAIEAKRTLGAKKLTV